MTRNRRLTPDELDEAQLQLYESILHGPRASQPASVPLVDRLGGLEGPFNAFLLQPALGQALQAVGATLRYSSQLPDRFREIAILVVAARRACAFETYAHEPVARSLGLTPQQLRGLRNHKYEALPPGERLFARAAAEMLDQGTLTDPTFDALRHSIGTDQIFELTVLVGYYSMLAVQLRVFDVPVPDASRKTGQQA